MTPEEEKAIFKWAFEHAEEMIAAVPKRKKDWRDWLAEKTGGNAAYIGAVARKIRDDRERLLAELAEEYKREKKDYEP